MSIGKLLLDTARLHIESECADIIRRRATMARLAHHRKKHPPKVRPDHSIRRKVLKAMATTDNQPNERSICPKPSCKANEFTWYPREKTWRCRVCRMPVLFANGIAEKNIVRDTSNPDGRGYKTPTSTEQAFECTKAMAIELLKGKRIARELRAEMRKQGYGYHEWNNATIYLKTVERSENGTGPVLIWLSETGEQRARELGIRSIVEFIAITSQLK